MIIKTITVDGNPVTYSHWSSQGPTLLCLHGLGSTKLSFLEINETLKKDFNIYALDLPGHGQTPAFERADHYQADCLNTWLLKVVDALGMSDFHLLAHSWGASVALYFAAAYPHRVKRMVLIDGGYHDFKWQDAHFKGLIDQGKTLNVTTTMADAMTYYERDFDDYVFEDEVAFMTSESKTYSRWSELLEVACRDLMRKDGQRVGYHAKGETAKAWIQYQYRVAETLPFEALKSPILLLYSLQPAYYTSSRQHMVAVFQSRTGSRLKAYGHAGHLIHWDDPQGVIEDVKHWLG